MLHEELSLVLEQFPVNESLNIFNAPLPKQWLQDALEMTGATSIRRRKLPPESVIRLIIGMSLMRNESIQAVANRLAFSATGLDNKLLAARSSLSTPDSV